MFKRKRTPEPSEYTYQIRFDPLSSYSPYEVSIWRNGVNVSKFTNIGYCTSEASPRAAHAAGRRLVAQCEKYGTPDRTRLDA